MKKRGRQLLSVFLIFWLGWGLVAAETLEDSIRARNFHEAMLRIQKELPRSAPAERSRLVLLLADCQVQLGQLDQAQETLALLEARTSPSRFFRVRGQLQKARGEMRLAEKDFRHGLKLSTTLEERVEALCELALLQTETEKAESLWSQALKEASTGEAPSVSWMRLYRTRYELLLESGNAQAALDFCRLMRRGLEARSDKRGLVWAYLAEIEALKRLSRFEEAEAVWYQALAASGEYSASVLLMWGYPTLYNRDDPPALQRVLSEVEKRWSSSDKWSEYERYHVRMMQAQIWLHGFNDARNGLHYLQLAEPLASPEPRPAGERMAVQMNFHKFGEGQSSDIEQVLWLQLRCFQELGRTTTEINGFMKSKLDLLPPRERPAWLFTLGKRTLPSQPQEAAGYFTRALEDASGFTRGLLLSEMMDTYYEYGQLSYALEKEAQLFDWLEQVEHSEGYEVFRYVVPQCLDREWSQALWSAGFGPQDNMSNRESFARLFVESGRVPEMEKEIVRKIEEAERSQDHFKAPQHLCLLAQLLILQGRYAEALAVCEKGQSLDKETQNFYSQFERLASYAHHRSGESRQALEKVRRAREGYARSDRYGATDFEIDCALLEIGYLLEARQFEEAIGLCEEYQPLSEGQDKRALIVARSFSLLNTDQLNEAWKILENLEKEVPDSVFAVAVETQRATILEAQGRHSEAVAQLDAALHLAESLASPSQQDVIAAWRQLYPSSAPTQETNQEIRAEAEERNWISRTDFLRLTGELMLTHPDFATTVPLLPTSLVQQSERLERDEILVEYFLGQKELVILMAASQGYALRRLSVERETLERWAKRVRTDKEAARQLGRLLVEPLQPLCVDKKFTILCHGQLLSLPWDLIELRNGPLVQNHEWKLWAGPSVASKRLSGKAGAYRVLALGAINGVELPGSEREVLALKESKIGTVKLLTGPSANKEQLNRFLPQADILHLATHSTPADIQLSDGPLSLDEIYGLPLRPGALVVLSSCEGADPGRQERGPVTLAGAFIAAGASEVIAGTDRVSDADAESLFIEFYQALQDGLSPSAALRRAKLKQMSRNPNGDWTKFIILGY